MENRVRRQRLWIGMKQEELARKSNISRQTISDIENGKHLPRVDIAYKVARCLRCDVHDIFREEPENELDRKRKDAGWVKPKK